MKFCRRHNIHKLLPPVFHSSNFVVSEQKPYSVSCRPIYKLLKHNKRTQRFIAVLLISLITNIVLLPLAPSTGFALTIGLNESKDHPKGIEIPPDDQMNPAEKVKPAPVSKAPSQQQASQPSAQPAAKQPSGPSKPYKGIFAAWQPLDKIFPLKTATLGVYGINRLSDQRWMVNNSAYTGWSNYYVEGGRSVGVLKDFKGKFQYNRQMKKQLTSSSMMNYSAKMFGFDVAFNKNINKSNNGSGASISTSINNVQKTTVGWSPSKRFSAGYAIDRNSSRSINPGAISQSVERKQSWTAKYQPSDKITVNASQITSANRNYLDGSVAKTIVTELKVISPVSKRLNLEAGYQFVGNRNIQGATSSDVRKSTRTLGASYQLTPDAKLNYTFSMADDKNISSSLKTDFGTTSREMKFQYAVFSWLKFDGKNQVSFSENAGKTAQRQAAFNVDHKNIKFLPGATSVNINKNVTVSPTAADPKTTSNYTLSVSTPVNYMKNRLALTQQYTLNENSSSSYLTPVQLTRSISNNYTALYKLSKTLSIGENINQSDNSSSTISGITSQSVNKTFTDKITYHVKQPFTKKIRAAASFEYSLSRTRNQSRNIIPTESLTLNNVLKNTGVFVFKQKKWNASYTVERGVNKPKDAAMSRALMHKLDWNLGDLFGYKFNGNFSTTKQNGGGVAGGVMKLVKEYGDSSLVSMSYEFTKNQSIDNISQNTFDKYFEIGAEFKH